jgi:hypothetical protein
MARDELVDQDWVVPAVSAVEHVIGLSPAARRILEKVPDLGTMLHE